MRESPLPVEFAELGGKVSYVRERIRGREWSSSCPSCGGVPHSSGHVPDRFRMWRVSKYGKPMGWCRACGKIWMQDKDYQPDPARIEAWRKEQIEYHERRKAESETALSHLRDENKWLVYYEALLDSPQAQGYWVGSGIDSEYYWHYWGLGYDPRHEFWFDTKDGWKQHITETATMAVRNINGEIVNIKHRLLEPFEGTKYRMEYTTHIEPLCIANLDNLVCDFAIICEGEKKNYVGWSLLDNVNVQAYGLPMTPSEEMLKSLQFKTAVYIPDPDALEERTNKNGKPLPPPANRIMETLKDRDVRILKLTDKLDDWILRTGASKKHFETLLKQARKV